MGRTDAQGAEYRSALQRYCNLQRQVGIIIHLFPDHKLPDLHLSDIERGWMLIDQADPDRIAATYGILQAGTVKEGALLLGESSETTRLTSEFRRLLSAAMVYSTLEDVIERIRSDERL